MSALFSLILAGMFLGIASLSGRYVVDSAVKLADILHVKRMIFAVIFVSISTSLPELAVSVFSSAEGHSYLTFGNLLGSDVVNLSLIFAILIWNGFAVSEERRRLIRNTLFFLILSCAVLLFSRFLSREISLFLLLLFFFYLRAVKSFYTLPKQEYFLPTLELVKNLFIFLLSCVSVVVFSKLAVAELIKFSQALGMKDIFLGSSLVALETSLPELVVALNSLKLGKPEVSLGDVTGSCVVNSTFILGIAGLIRPVALGLTEKILILFALASAVSVYLLSFERFLSKKHSLALFSIFILFALFLSCLQGFHLG